MSQGEKVLRAVAAWIAGWVSFPVDGPADQPLILALWCIATWCVPSWPSTSYLFVTSDGPGCGKTTLLEVLASLSLVPRNRATLRALSVVRDIEEHSGRLTYFFDQVEALTSTRISDEQAILLTGYRRGGEHGISQGTKQVAFSTYCSKAFAAIGSIARDLESRCLICRLSYGQPARGWTDEVVTREHEARQLVGAVASVLPAVPAWSVATFLQGREREIATPIWSVAQGLELSPATLAQVEAALISWSAWKAEQGTRPKYHDQLASAMGDTEAVRRRQMERQALTDLAAVLPIAQGKATGDVSSVRAVELMIEASARWRSFGGTGLDMLSLAALLQPFGVKPEVVRLVKGGKQVRGYRAKDVRAAVTLLQG